MRSGSARCFPPERSPRWRTLAPRPSPPLPVCPYAHAPPVNRQPPKLLEPLRIDGSIVLRSVGRFSGFRARAFNETAPSPAADLPPLPSGRPCFFGRPFVGGALLVGSAPALAGDFTLLLGGHRGKTPTLS